jgi:predicted O-methyltransferase YrrM
MTEQTWSQFEDYFNDALIGHDDALEQALRTSAAAGLPGINVSPSQGKLLSLLARSISADRILEIGTLGGYSTIWLARGLAPGGRLISLEVSPHHAEVANGNVAGAGLADRVEIRVGPAAKSLDQLISAGEPPFDLVFIDADKQSNPEYFAAAMRLTHPGSLIIVDNVVRRALLDPASTRGDAVGVRRMIDAMAADPRVDVTVMQTVGVKGHDGIAIALVQEPRS